MRWKYGWERTHHLNIPVAALSHGTFKESTGIYSEFIREILHSSKGSISHMLCHSGMDGCTWGAPAHPQGGAGSAQSNPSPLCLTFPLSHHSCCSLAGPREWVCFGGYPVPPTAPSTAEGEHGRLLEFQPWNGFKTPHKWASGGAGGGVIHSGALLAGGGSTSVFLKGKEQGLSLCSSGWWHIQPPLDPLVSPPAAREVTSLPLLIMCWGANSSQREKIIYSLKTWLSTRPKVLFQDSHKETYKGPWQLFSLCWAAHQSKNPEILCEATSSVTCGGPYLMWSSLPPTPMPGHSASSILTKWTSDTWLTQADHERWDLSWPRHLLDQIKTETAFWHCPDLCERSRLLFVAHKYSSCETR